jgi:hypothetical protein
MLVFDLDMGALSPVNSWLTARQIGPDEKYGPQVPTTLLTYGTPDYQKQLLDEARAFNTRHLGTPDADKLAPPATPLHSRAEEDAARARYAAVRQQADARRIYESTVLKKQIEDRRVRQQRMDEVKYEQAHARARAETAAIEWANRDRIQRSSGTYMGGPVKMDPATGKMVESTAKFDVKAGESRLAPAWANVGNLTSESRVPTGDYDSTSPWTASGGRNDMGHVMQQYKPLRPILAAPIYKPGDQVSIPMAKNWNKDKIREIQERMAIAGVLPGDTASQRGTWGRGEVMGAQSVMEYANLHGWDFEKALSALSSDALARDGAGLSGASSSSGSGYSGPLSTTSVDYSLSSLDQAKAALAGIMSQQIGRTAQPDEVKRFLAQLNAAERKAPMTTTSTRNKSGSWSSSTRRDKTIDPQAEAERFVASQNKSEVQDYGEVQYYDVINNLIGG